jgi:hypothetical protein
VYCFRLIDTFSITYDSPLISCSLVFPAGRH